MARAAERSSRRQHTPRRERPPILGALFRFPFKTRGGSHDPDRERAGRETSLAATPPAQSADCIRGECAESAQDPPTLPPRNAPFHFAGTAAFELNRTMYRQL